MRPPLRLRPPSHLAEDLLELGPDAQADLVLQLEAQSAGLVLRSLDGLRAGEGWVWSAATKSRYSSARRLLMVWAGLRDDALSFLGSKETSSTARVERARLEVLARAS